MKCLISGEEISELEKGERPRLLVLVNKGATIAAIKPEHLADVKTLKIVLTRDSRTGEFVADHAACIEAFRETTPNLYDDDY